MFWAGLVLAAVLSAQLATALKSYLAAQQLRTAHRHERTVPNPDVNPLGANFFLSREVEPWKMDRTLQLAADAGIGWVKQQFPWEEIESKRCNNPVADHLALGEVFGIRGTPAIVLEDGEVIPGYVNAERLAARLNGHMATK